MHQSTPTYGGRHSVLPSATPAARRRPTMPNTPQQQPSVSKLRRHLSLVLSVALAVSLLGVMRASPASADMGNIFVSGSASYQHWYYTQVSVSVNFDVRGHVYGYQEYLLYASCSVNGETVASLPELENDGYYQTNQRLSFTITEDGYHGVYCSGRYKEREACTHFLCFPKPWRYSTDNWSREFRIDRTPPTPTPTNFSRQPNEEGWFNGPFSFSWSGTDVGGSGLASCYAQGTRQAVVHVPAYSTDGYRHFGECTDGASNRGYSTFSYKMDIAPPVLSPVVPQGLTVGSTAIADPRATDYPSGIASQSCEPLDTTTAGTRTVECTATDVAGNVSTASATYDVAPVEHPLAVTIAGSGDGTVTSNPAGIDCGADCVGSFIEGSDVVLTAVAGSGSTFTGWSGDCAGNSDCQVAVDGARAVTATFINDGDADGIEDTAPPTHKDECKNGAWAGFNNPSFSNQGQCVSLVQAHVDAGR